jgi:Asp-tRNA(Asn)/Glu-tRNA(Gln) amidotransferase B subunit
MYRVIKYFTDLQDNNHEYNVGDIYPHNKKKVSASRIKELSTDKNRQGVPLIEKVEEPKEE